MGRRDLDANEQGAPDPPAPGDAGAPARVPSFEQVRELHQTLMAFHALTREGDPDEEVFLPPFVALADAIRPLRNPTGPATGWGDIVGTTIWDVIRDVIRRFDEITEAWRWDEIARNGEADPEHGRQAHIRACKDKFFEEVARPYYEAVRSLSWREKNPHFIIEFNNDLVDAQTLGVRPNMRPEEAGAAFEDRLKSFRTGSIYAEARPQFGDLARGLGGFIGELGVALKSVGLSEEEADLVAALRQAQREFQACLSCLIADLEHWNLADAAYRIGFAGREFRSGLAYRCRGLQELGEAVVEANRPLEMMPRRCYLQPTRTLRNVTPEEWDNGLNPYRMEELKVSAIAIRNHIGPIEVLSEIPTLQPLGPDDSQPWPHQMESKSSIARPCPVEFRGDDEIPLVMGIEQPFISPSQRKVIKILMEAYPRRLKLCHIERKGGLSPGSRLKELFKVEGADWKCVVRLSGQKDRKGYRLAWPGDPE